MKYETYNGAFVSREGATWMVSILQESTKAPGEVGELTFPADEPLVIEWGEKAKEEVMIGSTATLRVISPGDRTYEGLYTIEPGTIRMDVYRNGALYWSGTLDPEFYEEPYATAEGYEVELTFTDFGILDRLKYDLTGRQNCRTLLEYAIGKSGINYTKIDESLMTTSVPGAAATGLAQLDVRSDNWYDEEGEAATLEDMLIGILQPLALRIEQRNGKVWVYDLNGAYDGLPTADTYWMSDDQMMGVDKVVNNAKVTLSTYSSAELMSDELTYPGTYSADETNLTNSGTYFSYYVDYDSDNKVNGVWDYSYLSFTIFLNYGNKTETELAYKLTSAPYFHIQPLLGADESDGVAYMFYTGGHGSLSTGWPVRIGASPTVKTETVLMKTRRVYIPKISDSTKRSQYYIRLVEEILVDCRYNPFTTASDSNEGGNQGTVLGRFGYVMIPAAITLYDESGTALMHYSNEAVAKSSDKIGHLAYTKGEWKKGAATYGEAWLEWYDPDDRGDQSGVGGWKGNRHCIGLSKKGIFKSFGEMDDGQYMPYPEEGGYLEVSLYVGIWPYDYGETTFGSTTKATKKGLYDKLRWMLYKLPKVDIVRSNITKSDEELDDIEYSSYINTSAKEDLEIETQCGTSETPCPTSKAIYLNATTGEQVIEMERAGRTTQAEELLLGTLYSQYAERKTKLEGTALINAGDLTLYKDAMLEDKRLLVTGDVQDLQAETSELILIELRPDEYTESNE